MQEKYELIKEKAVKSLSKNPIEIAKGVMRENFVNMHGPEHHFLDGIAFLTAYRNAGGKVDLDKAADALAFRAEKMPGAMCGYWGICGSVASVGAALSVLHGTGPLSADSFYSDNMEYASAVIGKMSEIGGPRCCKRNAFLSIEYGAKFVKEKYGVEMETSATVCDFSARNANCIRGRCPFFKGDKKQA